MREELEHVTEDETVTISKEEYEKLKQLEESEEKQEPISHNIYDRVNISVETLDKVIVLGILTIIIAIIVGVLL